MSALRARTKPPHRTDSLRGMRRAPERRGRARTVDDVEVEEVEPVEVLVLGAVVVLVLPAEVVRQAAAWRVAEGG